MSDEDVVLRFASVAGFGSVNGPYCQRGNRKNMWFWNGQGEPARIFGIRMLPMFGYRRAARFVEALSEVDGEPITLTH